MLEIRTVPRPTGRLAVSAYRSWCKARRSLRGTDPWCSALPARGAVPVLASPRGGPAGLARQRDWAAAGLVELKRNDHPTGE